MGSQFLGEIRLFSGNFAPTGWAMCNGQILPINQNQALYSLLGTTYGGDGKTTFALPDLRGRVPMHFGDGPEFSATRGQAGGEETHVLTIPEMPAHLHQVNATASKATAVSPKGNVWAARENSYSYAQMDLPQLMQPAAISTAGQNSPHPNMQPYLVLNVIISLVGIYPPR
ncbi:MAG: phage tail protein [Clostridia bacterium]